MRENRLYGSEGGVGASPFRPLSTAISSSTAQALSSIDLMIFFLREPHHFCDVSWVAAVRVKHGFAMTRP